MTQHGKRRSVRLRRLVGRPLMNVTEWLLIHRFSRAGHIVGCIADRIRWTPIQRKLLAEAWNELQVEFKIKGYLPKNRTGDKRS